MVLCASYNAFGVGVELYVGYMGVGIATDADESAELCADGALKGGEHGVDMLIFHGDDVVCEYVGVVIIL